MHAKKVLIPFLLLLALVPLCACTATVPTPGVPLPQLVIGSDNCLLYTSPSPRDS